jgi:hypothetical protein
MNATVTTAIRFSEHALSRYGERVRPGLTGARLAAELQRVLATGTIRADAPPWLGGGRGTRADLWIEVGDVAFPLVHSGNGLLALTCLVRGGISDFSRHRRSERRRARRAARGVSGRSARASRASAAGRV